MSMILLILGTVLAIMLPLLVLFQRHVSKRAINVDNKSVAVLVLGDLGRSPRMMYHAQSLSKSGFNVLLIGFAGTPVLDYLQQAKNVQIVHIAQPPAWISKLPKILFLLVAPYKLVYGACSLFYTLVYGLPFAPKAMLVQTPPALPTLPIVQLACKLQHTKLIIDWHNTAYSILGMRLGQNSKPTQIAKDLEGYFGRNAHAHFFVTQKMQGTLSEMWQLSGTKQTFTDRPQEFAQRLDVREAHQLFHKINALREPRVRALAGIYDTSSTVFTSASPMASGQADYNTGRPALLVSSTSWTADEDFSILLQALDAYETLADDVKNNLPKLVVLITGKGPMKEDFEKQVEQKEKMWKYVRCRTTWLEMEDYPRLLQCADLGVSLHSSSSGLDFPMKIVDMLGAGLKVLALDFACVHEGLQESEGRIFRSADELAVQLQEELRNFPDRLPSSHSQVRKGRQVWQESWSETVLPIVKKCCTN